MVKSFQFSSLPRIFFGTGRIKVLPALIKRYGKVIILVTGKGSFMNSPVAASLFDGFRDEGISYHHFTVPGEPSPEMIDNAVGMISGETVDIVVSIGGGSVLDAGKAISAIMYLQGSVKDYLEGVGTMEHSGKKLPFIAIPTTSGTGSEATKNAVISHIGKDGFKRSLRHDNFVPDIAIVDPELTVSCPEKLTAASGMDCFTQLIESFLSDRACEYTDALAWEGIKAVRSSLIQCYRNGQDINARSGMSFAALTSGICLANAGLGVVHGFGSSIGGMYNIPHGVVCGSLMAPANKVIVRELRNNFRNSEAIKKYVSLGRLFLNVEGKSDDFYIDGFIDYLRKLSDDLSLPNLGLYGIDEKDLESICRITELKNNPVRLNTENLMEILKDRL